MAQKRGLMLVSNESGQIRAEIGIVPKGFTVYGHFPLFTVYRRSEGKRPKEYLWVMFLFDWCIDHDIDIRTFEEHKRNTKNEYGD